MSASRKARQYEQELRDPALTALLQEAFLGDPALQETPERTDRIMRTILAAGVQPAQQGLQDQELTALLQEAFGDDPALQEAPGRTDRIMRTILTTGVRPVQPARQGFRWAPLAWATGALTATAAAVMLAVGAMLPVMQQAEQVAANVTPPQSVTAPAPKEARAPLPVGGPVEAPVVLPKLPAPQEKPQRAWTPTVESPAPASPPAQDTLAQAPQTGESAVHMAAALYSAGSAARSMGDYESAYQAYEASYDAMPTTDALLASATALERVSAETLAANEG